MRRRGPHSTLKTRSRRSERIREWRPLLHDLGTCEVKHGVQVAVVNLWSDDVGNRQLPQNSKLSGNSVPGCVGPKWQLQYFYWLEL